MKEEKTSVKNITEKFNANEGYLNVALRILASQGWLKHDIVEEKGLSQVSDVGELTSMVQKVLEDNPENVQKYREGKTKLFGFFVGQVLKASGGSANPQVVKELMQGALDAHSVQ